MWQTKITISLLPKSLWPPNLRGWWLTLKGCCLQSHIAIWSRSRERSRDKLKPLISTTTLRIATTRERMLTYLQRLPPVKLHGSLVTLSCKIVKLKLLCLHYYNAYSHGTWQVGDFPWGVSLLIVTSLFNHMILLDDLTKLKTYLFYNNT